ncbi:MAG TPA: hypothetical protein VL361_05415 [Candidatus Limnocylindrales bacterium]|jgi:hypothetical protein|nr:hypothetical protein [Candidatus Limnocylindrales bacterium]
MKTKIGPITKLFSAICLLASASSPMSAGVHYVDVSSAGPAPPYCSWATEETTIQDAVDVADPGDQIFVADGIYQKGGRVAAETAPPTANRIAVIKPLTIQSVHGPSLTIIQGYQIPDQTNGDEVVRCAYLTNGASLIGFTLTGGTSKRITYSGLQRTSQPPTQAGCSKLRAWGLMLTDSS